MKGTYTVYKAEYSDYVYYGITTSLKKRRLDHIRHYSTDKQYCHPSTDALTLKAKEIGVCPSLWKFSVVESGLTKDMALEYKAYLIGGDANSINIRYKNSDYGGY